MKYSNVAMVVTAALLLTGCAAKQTQRPSCAAQLDAAWKALDIAKAKGFSGTVSYTKAVGLLSVAKSMQTVENFSGCVKHAQDARYYINQSVLGR